MLIKHGESIPYKDNPIIKVDATKAGVAKKLDEFDEWYTPNFDHITVGKTKYDMYVLVIQVDGTFNEDGSARGSEYQCFCFPTKAEEDEAIAKIEEIFDIDLSP